LGRGDGLYVRSLDARRGCFRVRVPLPGFVVSGNVMLVSSTGSFLRTESGEARKYVAPLLLPARRFPSNNQTRGFRGKFRDGGA
jgi:hypothetical protein